MILLSNHENPKPFWKPSLLNTYQNIISNECVYVVKDQEALPNKKLKSLKLRLRPTKEHKLQLNRWTGCVRFIYNKAISIFTNPKAKHKSKNFVKSRLATVKHRKTGKANSFYRKRPWLKDCPASVRKEAVLQAHENLQSCFTNLKNKNIERFSRPFKTKKKEQLDGYCFSIEKQDVKKDKNKLIITNLGEIRYYRTKQLHKLIPRDEPDHDCKIQKTKYGEYFL